VVFDRLSEEMCAALTAADDVEAGPAERAEMLMEIAMGLQHDPSPPTTFNRLSHSTTRH
jgi:hypothetical protein